MADWSSLPCEIWNVVFDKLLQDEEFLLKDLFRCARVCSSWSFIIRHRFTKPQFPWLMLPPEDNSQLELWRFLDIATNKTHKSHLPELNETQILASSDGWLIVDHLITGDLLLFNPFSRVQIQLPALDEGKMIYQVYLSISSDCGYTVVVDVFTHLSFVRAGDNAWSRINYPEKPIGYRKGTFCKGLFYLLYNKGPIVSFDLTHLDGGDNPRRLPFRLPPQLNDLSPSENIVEVDYLVVLPDDDQLLLVRLTSDSGQAKAVDIFRLDPKETLEMRNLGKYSLFLINGNCGPSYNVMSLTRAQGLTKGNLVYIADEEDRFLSLFDTEVRCIKRIDKVGVVAVWVTPVVVKL